MHLVVLLLGFVSALVIVTEFQGARQLDQARDRARSSAQFVAELGARTTVEAVEAAREQVDALAANPGLPAVLEDAEGCTLTARAIPPFGGGYIDIVDPDGTVVCSSRALPPEGWYADEPWVDPAGGAVTALMNVPDASAPVVVVTAPIGDVGIVALIMETTGIEDSLATRFGGDGERFGVRDADGAWLTEPLDADEMLRGTSAVPALGWVVESAIDEDVATANARTALDQSRLVALLGSLVLLLAVIGVNRLLVSPVRRLDEEVGRAMAGELPRPVGGSGPSEVVALADHFSTLARNVESELVQRRQAEAEAQRAAASLRRLFEANPLAMWVHDRETGEILMANAALADLLGRDVPAGTPVSSLLPPDAPAWMHGGDDDGRELRRVGPWRFVAGDDESLECDVTSDVLEFDGHAGRLVIVEDVTAARRTQRLISDMQRMDSLGQLAGGIAHDFNNLLTVIINYVRLARDRLDLVDQSDAADSPGNRAIEDVCADLDQVLDASERAAALTSQLLAFAKGEAIEMLPVDVNATVTRIGGLLDRTLGEHVEISMKLADGLPAALANPAQLEQILVNLAVNARDAMPTGGALTIETSAVALADGERPDLGAGTYVRVRVSDTGIGMDAAVRSRAFEPFFTTKARDAGTGLGLSTVYGIVVRSGGAMELYSEPGRGTTIGVMMPSTERADPSPAVVAIRDDEPRSGRVLVVEDDGALRLVTERILVNGGYEVETASDGASALERLGTAGPLIDLMLTDAVMPGMLGVELVEEVRRRHPDVRVAMMSGHLPRTLDPGGDHHRAPVRLLGKPFGASELLDFVSAALAPS